ncbi:MAG: STAS domain-containing protein, partial [Defluviicoccus sp.]|nr:STAS domain-containing protein [Defluviicoccus sp.]
RTRNNPANPTSDNLRNNTLGLTVFVDLITAVAIGLIAGGMVHARRLGRLELDSVVSVPLLEASFFADDTMPAQDDPHAARVGMVALRGTLSVASSHKLVSVVGLDIKEHEVVIFDFSDTVYIDDSAAMVIGKLLGIAAESGTECIVMGLRDDVAATLRSLDILGGVPADRVVETLAEARRIAREALEIDAADRSE